MGYVILINGVTRTFRDQKEVAYDAATYLKERSKGDIVQIRDEETGAVGTILLDGRMGCFEC